MPGTTPVVRFSLATMLLVFAWAALLCIGLTAPSRFWSGLTALVSLFTVMTAIVAAVYRTGHARAFAIGFAIFGCSYFLWLRLIEGYNPLSFSRTVGERSFIALNNDEWDSVVTARRSRPGPTVAIEERRDRFVATIQSATIIIVATVGGFIGRYLSIKCTDTPSIPPAS